MWRLLAGLLDRKGAKARRQCAQLIAQLGSGAAGTVELMADGAEFTGKFLADDGRVLVLTVDPPMEASDEVQGAGPAAGWTVRLDGETVQHAGTISRLTALRAPVRPALEEDIAGKDVEVELNRPRRR